MRLPLCALSFLLAAVPVTAWAGSIAGKVQCRGTVHNGEAIIYAERLPREAPPAAAKPAVLDQVNLTFVPHVLPVLVGTTVAFPNSDEVRHNVFSPSPPKRFNLGTYPKGVTRHVTFDKAGEVALLCNVHAEMSAYVLVLGTPHFAVSARDGSYALQNLPPGQYTVTAWHERLKPVSMTVEIRGKETVPLNFDLAKKR